MIDRSPPSSSSVHSRFWLCHFCRYGINQNCLYNTHFQSPWTKGFHRSSLSSPSTLRFSIQIECKRALKREEILGHHDNDNNECKSFRPSSSFFSHLHRKGNDRLDVSTDDIDRSPSSPPIISATSPTPMSMCPPSMPIANYNQYCPTSTGGTMINALPTGWIVNPSLPPMFHPMMNSTQPFGNGRPFFCSLIIV